MNRLLVLHCGPMKTGSTAIQDVLLERRDALRATGVSYHHIRARGLVQQLRDVLEQERDGGCDVLLLSSEFFAQMPVESLQPILELFPGERHAVLVSRPLREIYPSLYLQNLKGSSRRVTTFRAFLENQLLLDQHIDPTRPGQLMNASALDRRMQLAGCTTHWIRYDRLQLLDRLAGVLREICGVSFELIRQPPSQEPAGLSPRRSLRMELAGVARLINRWSRRGWLSDQLREMLLIVLLDLSDVLRRFLPFSSPLSAVDRRRCDQLDALINIPFLRSRGMLLEGEQGSDDDAGFGFQDSLSG